MIDFLLGAFQFVFYSMLTVAGIVVALVVLALNYAPEQTKGLFYRIIGRKKEPAQPEYEYGGEPMAQGEFSKLMKMIRGSSSKKSPNLPKLKLPKYEYKYDKSTPPTNYSGIRRITLYKNGPSKSTLTYRPNKGFGVTSSMSSPSGLKVFKNGKLIRNQQWRKPK